MNYENFPKNLFLIHIGSYEPEWVEFSYSNWKKLNPDFNVQLVKVTYKDKINNEDFLEMIDMINTKTKDENEFTSFAYIYMNKINWWVKGNVIKSKSLVYFSDIFRRFLIYKYGGIYVDSDTFPFKPIKDSNFLSLFDDNYKFVSIYHDSFLLSGLKGYCSVYVNKKPYHREIPFLNCHRSFSKRKKYQDNLNKFINCELTFNDSSIFSNKKEECTEQEWNELYQYYFFDHYRVSYWKNRKQNLVNERLKEAKKFYNLLNIKI